MSRRRALAEALLFLSCVAVVALFLLAVAEGVERAVELLRDTVEP